MARPATAPLNIAEATNEHDLEFWSDVYTQACLPELSPGLKFAEFLRSPWTYLHRLKAEDAAQCVEAGFRPLLPAQRRVRDRLDAQKVVPISP